jgi:glyoxylase-like metal-dependent hydrolase (beta-lactamase superfamily II)
MSNVYLLLDEQSGEAALIDTGLHKDRPRLLEALAEIGVAQSSIRRVFLTHAHCDHAGNARFLAKGAPASTGCPPVPVPVSVSQIEWLYLSGERSTYMPAGWRRLLRPAMTLVMRQAERSHPVPRHAAEHRFQDGELIEAPGGALRVVSSPGHSPGHAAFHRERDGLLFSGDAILNADPRKRIGLGVPIRAFCHNYRQAKQSAIRLAALSPSMLLSGHGPPLTDNAAGALADFAATLGKG